MKPILPPVMRRLRAACRCALLVPLSVCTVQGQDLLRHPEYRAVFEAADARDAAVLLSMLGESDAVAERALLALGSLQDPSTVPALLEVLKTGVPRSRAAAAFALGQTLRGTDTGISRDREVTDLLKLEEDEAARAALMEAIGDFGGHFALSVIAGIDAAGAGEAASQALSISRFAVRGFRSAEAAERLANIFIRYENASGGSAARRYSLYGLFRVGDSSILAPHVPVILRALASSDARTRIFAAAAAGRAKHPSLIEPLTAMPGDSVTGARVNALRSLAALSFLPAGGRRVAHALRLQLQSADYQTVKAAAQALGAAKADPRTAAVLKKMIDTCRDADLRNEAISALAAAFPEFARDVIAGWRSQDDPPIAAVAAAGPIAVKLGRADAATVEWIGELLLSQERRIAAAAAASWMLLWKLRRERGLRGSADSSADREFRNLALGALRAHSREANNAAAVQAIAEGLCDPAVAEPARSAEILEALGGFSPVVDAETVIALLKTLERLKDTAVTKRVLPYAVSDVGPVRAAAVSALRSIGVSIEERPPGRRASVDWSPLLAFKGGPVLRLRSTRGEIGILLLPDEAPFTVLAVLRLVRSGFYDGLNFHRVVPNFVAQGGDPRGDGTGGPAFTLRSEFSRLKFERGAVGMASAGKDTEGSQFFIMHSEAPHLDGRYTVFGRVIEGMDAADRLRVGDKIISVRVDDVPVSRIPR